jgi:prefoldin subunit 5
MTIEEEQIVTDLHEEIETLSQQVEYLRMGIRFLKQTMNSGMSIEAWIAEFNRLEPRDFPEQDPAIRGGLSVLEESPL